MAQDPQQQTIQLLKQIAEDLADIKDVLCSFTNDGFPLRQTIPTAELLSSLSVATALIARADPRITQNDLNTRLAAAQEIGMALLRLSDSYQMSTQVNKLESLQGRTQ